MRALKTRLATYFVRAPIPDSILGVGAHDEWHELDLWERWTTRTGSEAGFKSGWTRLTRTTLIEDVETQSMTTWSGYAFSSMP